MLQVERKKERRISKWILLVLLGIIAVAGCIFGFFMLRTEKPKAERQDTRGYLSEREPEEITQIRITVRGRQPWIAKRNSSGDLVMIQEEDASHEAHEWVLDPALGERIEDALAHLGYEAVLTENEEDYRNRLDEFGLENPTLTAETEYLDGAKTVLRIGDNTGIEGEDCRFMLIEGDPRLFVVAGNLVEDLIVEQELLHPVDQPEIQIARIDRITIRDEAGNITAEWKLKGMITDADAAENWLVTVPVNYPADQDQIVNLKKSAGNIRLGLYVSEGSKAALSQYGLDQPRAEIEIHLAEGSTGQIIEGGVYQVTDRKEETFCFLIGNVRNEMTDYCLYNGTVYTMNHFTMASLTEIDPRDTLARYPVTVATDNLSSLEIVRENGETDRYDLTYISEPEIENEGAMRTAVLCKKNGEDMEYAAFEAAYERMRVVDVSGTLPAGWQKKETRTVYTMKTRSGDIHRVELSDFDAMHDAVTVDGWTMFYLIKDGMGEMP